MPVEFDVLVAGGGPAGAVVALCLARYGWRVALIEATAYDSDRPGETVPPEINPVLRKLGLWDQFQALTPLEAPGIVSVWGDPVPASMDFVGNAHGCGWHVDRNRFDSMLCAEAEKAGAKVYLKLRFSGEWRSGEVRARKLVDATGRNGLRLDSSNARETEDVLLAITLRLAWSGDRPNDLRTCIETTPAGWWYSAPLPDGGAMSMFFTDREVYTRDGISVAEQLAVAPLTNERLRAARIAASRVVHAPSSCRETMIGEDWVTVGDSASSYDPLSGRGIFKALRQGEAAARALDAELRGDAGAVNQYVVQVRSEFKEYSRQRRAYYAIEQRWPESRFWRRRKQLHAGLSHGV